MKVVVLGTGMIGTTIVSEIAKFEGIESVMAVDVRQESIDNCLKIARNPKVIGKTTSLSIEEDFINVLEGADVAVGCLPHSLSLTAVKAAIASKCHLVDLVGSMFIEKMELHTQAQEAGVTIIPGCGVAPGITNFLAAQGIELLDEADEAVLICGGVPRWPVPPLWYQVVFRLESVLGLYTKPAVAIKNGEIIEVPPLSELESLTFPEPVGACEAVITDAHSTAFTLKGKVGNLTEKTVRYPGHWEKMKVLAELGFLDHNPIEVQGVMTAPVKFSEKILSPKMKGVSNEDVTVVRVEVNGTKDGKAKTYTWEMVDVYDHERNISSMAKTTALPAALAAKWIAEKKISETGVVPIETVIVNDRFAPFLEALKELGIHIEMKD
ncbi:saccharopine dehydrogenase C-terminal domain-containing protein [Sporosarcina gallistercoris]|uniref:saccharopine dehydrogenase family protein n=1 Tax=Sporosarcina gallistercoris TaxID=2762245 RepID=UPI003D2A3308